MLTKASVFILPLGPALASAGLMPSWLKGPGRQGIKCGVKGFADTDNNYFWSASKKLTSHAACSARCDGDARCESFGFDDRVCMLFDEPLAGNFEADRRSDLTFYDSQCDGAAKSTTSLQSAPTNSRPTRTRTGGRQTATAVMPTVTVALSTSTNAEPAITPALGVDTTDSPVATAVSSGAGSLISPVSSATSEDAPTSVDDGGASTTSGASDGSDDSGSGSDAAATGAATASSFPNVTSAVNATSGSGSGLISLTAASGNGSSRPVTDAPAAATPTADSGSSTGTSPDDDSSEGSVPSAANGTIGSIVGASNGTNSTASNVAVPDGCDIPASFTVTSFSWFNSSSNLDCVQPNFANGSQVCYDAQLQPCDPAAAPDSCTCRPFCSAGVPAAAYELAAGRGPADAVAVTLGGPANGTCRQSNPPEGATQVARHAEVGAGAVDCGSAATTVMRFFGDSSAPSNGSAAAAAAAAPAGRIDFYPPAVGCGGRAAAYGASFPLLCESDEDGNANCTTATPLTLSLTGFLSTV